MSAIDRVVVPRVVVMGVSAAGKSTVAAELASMLGVPFADADDLHPEDNRAKMAAGVPLTDDDRWPWLAKVGTTLSKADHGLVIACSALRRSYRDLIRHAAPDAFFLHLTGDRELLRSRSSARVGHFMPHSLLESQFATLEPLEADERGATIDVKPPPEAVVFNALSAMHR